jgi:hypothetical protein
MRKILVLFLFLATAASAQEVLSASSLSDFYIYDNSSMIVQCNYEDKKVCDCVLSENVTVDDLINAMLIAYKSQDENYRAYIQKILRSRISKPRSIKKAGHKR